MVNWGQKVVGFVLMSAVKFNKLRTGQTIGVLAPGGPVRPDRYESGIRALEQLGYKVSCPLDPTKYYGDYTHAFSNASAGERVQALYELLADEEVAVILAARGAFGTIEMLSQIDFAKVKSAGKTFVGYSDTTNLLIPWVSQAGISAVHGATLSKEFAEFDESDDSKASVLQLLELLTEDSYEFKHSCSLVRDGSGQGELLAGNLAVLESLVGTSWDVDYSGKILVLEEIGEKPYRVYRSLLHLHHAGKLGALAGLVFGRFDNCSGQHGPSVEQVFEKFIKECLPGTTYPIVSGLPFGHNGLNYALPLGQVASIKSETFSFKA